MAANAANRKAARIELGSLINTAMVVGGDARASYAYKRGEFTEGPTILVYSGPALRSQHGMGDERYNSQFTLFVDIYVPDASTAAGWSEADVEDKVDDLNKALADVIKDNEQNANWDFIELAEIPSNLLELEDEQGLSWVMERHQVLVTKYQ